MRLLTLGFLLIATVADPTQARAQGTSFTYQGRLIYGNEAVNGSNDLTFTLYDAATGDGMVGASNVFAGLLLSNGNFTVTLDFGAGAFGGAARWLEIATRPGAGSGAFTNLAPRQPITPTPYAMFAGAASAAGLTGTIPLAQLPGTVVTNGASGVNFNGAFTGDGGGLTNLNISSLSTNVALRSGGNTFSGDQNFASGRVGIGTATPVSLLDVRVPGSVTGGISFGSYSGVLAPKYIREDRQ